ncbi:MAG: N6-L-threonylcarbamoyladenine synthase [Flavobacteriaceae bacterium]|jgi:N6-L-threonylcarbamoyladenine synthase
MKILSIETSCDETAVSIIEATGDLTSPTFTVLGDGLFSQAHLHAEYGGVFPLLAKREHSKNLIPMLDIALSKGNMKKENKKTLSKADEETLTGLLEREPELLKQYLEFIPNIEKPEVDLISVTQGPGLTPALWVGLNFAKALALSWNIPIVPVNHMEGHIVSVLENKKNITLPAIALLISGGHTQIVHIENWGTYKVTGETRDDAVGEAFDKVARMIGLSYPGGPEISKLAEEAREQNQTYDFSLPRPMIYNDDIDFSFSGLKTAVRRLIDGKEMTIDFQRAISLEFENAVTEVLLKKTLKAIENTNAHSLIIAGGVSANIHIQKTFIENCKKENITLYLPQKGLSGDNSIMIGMAGYFTFLRQKKAVDPLTIKAIGNLRLS